jgi:ankyrin repeat protein
VKILVEHDRTCVQKLDKDGRTPVYVACYHGNYEILKLLVENGGNLANI